MQFGCTQTSRVTTPVVTMNNRVYVVCSVNTDHGVREVERVFADSDAAEEYCEQTIANHYADIAESEHTEQVSDYIWTNGVDKWGLVIDSTQFVGENARDER